MKSQVLDIRASGHTNNPTTQYQHTLYVLESYSVAGRRFPCIHVPLVKGAFVWATLNSRSKAQEQADMSSGIEK
jgi:hypothetical protein